jgi:dTDP-4-dehydrorhamnose reductase
MCKILLLGKGGQVGWELQRSLAPMGEVTALDFDSTEHCGDFTNLTGLTDTVRAIEPSIIVNAGAHTAVDRAEGEPELARTINALAPGALAVAAKEIGAWLVHYSTDYVFDGSGSKPWVETDAPAPLSVYGHTKLEGEQLIQASACKHLTFRTSWVYAARGGNFAKTMLKLAQERDTLKVINDQIGAPTGAELLADVTAHALRIATSGQSAGTNLSGLYHVAAGGQTTWFDYANHVLSEAIKIRPSIQLTAKSVEPVPTSAFQTAAKRPLNSRLDTRKIQSALSLNLPHWTIGVNRMLIEHLEKTS